MIMITVLRKLLQLLATCSPPRITVWASPSLAVAAALPCQQLEVADNIIPWSSWPSGLSLSLFEEANNIISWSYLPSTLSCLLSNTFWGRQHPLFSYLDFLIFFGGGWQHLLLSSLMSSSFFWGGQHAPLIILTFVSLLEEAENFLLSFLFLDIFVEVNEIHFWSTFYYL